MALGWVRKWGMVPESGDRLCWGSLGGNRVHLPTHPLPRHNRGASPSRLWRARSGFSGTLIRQSKAGPQPHWPPAHRDPAPCRVWLVALAPAPAQPAPGSPAGSLPSTSFPRLSPFPSSPPGPSQSLPLLSDDPPLLSLPSPPHLGAPLPCIMHAVEAPNRIRHLRPSSRRESLCK